MDAERVGAFVAGALLLVIAGGSIWLWLDGPCWLWALSKAGEAPLRCVRG